MLEPMLKPIRAFADSRGYSYFDIFGEPTSGQINIGYLQPDTVKGLHYHLLQWDHWFCFKGDIHVILARPKNLPNIYLMPYTMPAIEECEIQHYYIGEHNPCVLSIPPQYAHGYVNVSKDTTGLLYWVTKAYDPKNPDEYRVDWNHFGEDIWKPENK